jgi:hypothetical protein
MSKKAVGLVLMFALDVALNLTPQVPAYITVGAWLFTVFLVVLWLVAHLAEQKANSIQMGLLRDDPESLRAVYGSTLAMVLEQYELVRKGKH